MSRIGRMPVKIDSGVKANLNERTVSVVGPKGTLNFEFRPEISIVQESDTLVFDIKIPSKKASAYLGMTRSILNGMVKGVTTGFEKKLELVGVGYRAKMNGSNAITITVGYSHPVEFPLPAGITAEVTDNTAVLIKGIDKQLVGQVAANIRKIRKPEPYKGKGIRYAGEIVRRKQGKSGKV